MSNISRNEKVSRGSGSGVRGGAAQAEEALEAAEGRGDGDGRKYFTPQLTSKSNLVGRIKKRKNNGFDKSVGNRLTDRSTDINSFSKTADASDSENIINFQTSTQFQFHAK